MAETEDARSSSAVLGALNLYLDLLNLMLFLLRIFGNSR
jgi:FtsH-binding integral membrane protein